MKNILILLGLLLLTTTSQAQIVPPGLGEVSLAGWMAVGLDQNLRSDQNKSWKSSTYIGHGRQNEPGKENLLQKSGILILNQEFYHRFHENWEISFALSYRNQDLYAKEFPHHRADPQFKHEFRYYSRFSYLWKSDFVEITPTFRQEVMRYFEPGFSDFKEDWRLRSRFRLKFSFPLNPDKNQKIILYSEQLFAASRHSETHKWSAFKYNDSRFSAYYSYGFTQFPMVFNIGYMHNLIGKENTFSGHYLAIDFIFKNLF